MLTWCQAICFRQLILSLFNFWREANTTSTNQTASLWFPQRNIFGFCKRELLVSAKEDFWFLQARNCWFPQRGIDGFRKGEVLVSAKEKCWFLKRRVVGFRQGELLVSAMQNVCFTTRRSGRNGRVETFASKRSRRNVCVKNFSKILMWCWSM